ncbi:MAG: hypothetical protein ACOC4G_00390, partial [Bacillota bacterium]
MKIVKIITAFMILTLLFTLPLTAAEIDIGGEVKTTTGITFSDEKMEDFKLQQFLNMELYLPQSKNTSARFEFDLRQNTPGDSNFIVKKLYLRRKFDDFQITMGRQPISWSYGALINPVDFDIGAEVMDESTTSKYRDGLRFYMPLDWDSSLEVISVPE